ncbi:hypothetical protein [Hymenobacter coccineus]|uniref:SdpI/YhfL protein family n=1 Tax=Hymenobacter coccineus TaxID=1908235 RepID=A0A1G1SSK0_9BACT|nr:hypothetical protein [Hymenobacter coccineus]OGX81602.1 hypothetical protein BEN49_15270 [Hymenobacter coccineus]
MLAAAEMSDFALALVGTGTVVAAVLMANPPARTDSALFRRWTRGLPADVAARVSDADWKRLVRTYYAWAMGALLVLGALILWVLPAQRALPATTLFCLATVFGARFFVRRHLLRQAPPLA